MHFESSHELPAGSADVLVRMRRGAKCFVRLKAILSRFALSAGGDVRAPSRMRLPNSESASVPRVTTFSPSRRRLAFQSAHDRRLPFPSFLSKSAVLFSHRGE